MARLRGGFLYDMTYNEFCLYMAADFAVAWSRGIAQAWPNSALWHPLHTPFDGTNFTLDHQPNTAGKEEGLTW